MAARDRPSTIDQLPPEIREMIGRLRLEKGYTIDAIRHHLQELLDADDVPSRSALGRHVRDLKVVGDRMRRATAMTEAVARMGNRADNKMLRGTLELVNSILLEVSLAEEEGEDGVYRAVQFNPAQVKALAQTAESLARAEKLDADREKRIREQEREMAQLEMRQKLDAAGRTGELDPDALARARRIMGFVE